MAFESAALLGYRVPVAEQTLHPKDCILYALSVGASADASRPDELRFVYEKDLHALPMMANVLAHPGLWVRAREAGIDWRKVVHGEQAFTLHRPLPMSGTLVGTTRIVAIVDKGRAKGAFVYSERQITDKASGKAICTVTQTNVCRGDGGCGSIGPPPKPLSAVPARSADRAFDVAIPANAALLYRLNGDTNPLHVDPEAARAAGFDRPILHGLCAFGYAGLTILRNCLACDERRIKGMQVRFTSPIFPGDTLRLEVWTGPALAFRASAVGRTGTVLDYGKVEIGEVGSEC